MIALAIDRQALLAEARARVTGRRDIACAAARSEAARQELDACLEAGWHCTQALARPAAALVRLDAHSLDHAACGWRVGSRLPPDAPGATAFAYVVTCGYDSRAALQWLGGDYASYHFQDAFARELVFALGRQVGRHLRGAHPGRRFTREVVGSDCGVGARPKRRWDPRAVAALLRHVGGGQLGVATGSGDALVPLHSLLGVMVGQPQWPAPIERDPGLAWPGRTAPHPSLQPGTQE